MIQPEVLVLDEPTTGLDPRSRQIVWTTVRDLVAEGVTLLLTTQYLEEADVLADHILLIDHGRAVASGTPSELKAQIGEQRVDVVAVDDAGFEAARPRPRHPVRRHGRPRAAARLDPRPRRDRRPRPRVSAAVRDTGVAVDEVALRRPTLDDAFLTLTGQMPADDTDTAPEGAAA